MTQREFLPHNKSVSPTHPDESLIGAIATRDHVAIRRWAGLHGAEPATGVATATGPATMRVNDGGADIRFNFPGAGRFRPISWEEWFERFDAGHLIFLHEEEPCDRAYALWLARGGGHGHDLDDWLEAERQLGRERNVPSQRYRLVPVEDLRRHLAQLVRL